MAQATGTDKASAADELLTVLEQTVLAEREALVRLDKEAIERFGSLKQQLGAQLKSVGLDPRAIDRLKKLRSSLMHNQLLLVHARDCARAALSSATGLPSAPGAPIGAVRVNLRG